MEAGCFLGAGPGSGARTPAGQRHIGTATVHDLESPLLDQRGDGSPDGRPTHAVHIIGQRLLRWEASAGRQLTAVEVGKQVRIHLLPHQFGSVVVDSTSTVVPRHAATVDILSPAKTVRYVT